MSSGVMTIDWAGRKYEVDVQSISAAEFRSIKVHLGLKQGAFYQSFSGVADMDPDALVALLWIAKKRSGENVSLRDFDDVPALELVEALTLPEADVDDDAEAGQGKAEDGEPTST